MKITIEVAKPGEEDEIIVRCASLDERLLKVIQSLRTEDQLTGYIEDKIVKLPLKEIYYFEAVDNKVFAYTAKETFEIRKKLYEIEQDYEYTDFLRISKSAIVNVSKIAYVKPIFNGRFEAKLKNDEKIIVSRQYVSGLKKKIRI
ncbi:MAG: LytTR family transcriptional regulator DNA-binding domain-containing protein [Lachnospiraceae bacterium]|nr:LytTR family transcriptional regulator DNA-binding domain-containing protein [Lachnospiraceae bacterium]